MNMIMKAALAGALTTTMGGCATHPLPDDYSRVKTVEIVRKIRCEAQQVLRAQVLELLRSSGHPNSLAVADEIERNDVFKNSDRRRVDEKSRHYIEKYDNAAIALQFTLDMSESNDLGAGIDLARPLTGGALSLGFGTGAKFDRANTRFFIVSYPFEKLLTEYSASNCADFASGANMAYPITGRIGLAEVIDTFIKLNNVEFLQAGEKNVVLSDTLKFTTTLTANMGTAKLELKAAGSRWQTTGASGHANNTRVDQHQVVVSLSFGPETNDKAASTAKIARTQAARARSKGRTPAEQRAIEEFDTLRVLRLDKTLRELGVR